MLLKNRNLAVLLMSAVVVTACGASLPAASFHFVEPPTAPLTKCFGALCPANAKPVVLGGQDYSPPTLANVARWQRAGHFKGKSVADIKKAFTEAGYKWNEGKYPCNCRCVGTPHALLGGKCLEELLPATADYDAAINKI